VFRNAAILTADAGASHRRKHRTSIGYCSLSGGDEIIEDNDDDDEFEQVINKGR
jgi:hypothetical protein